MSRGGGVMLAIDQSIPSKIIPSPNDIEVIIVQIMAHNPIKLCLVYNPPNCGFNYQQKLLTFLSDIMQSKGNVVIMGDFNVPDIRWPTLSSDTDFSTQLCDLIFQYNFTQLIESPTHVQGNILDLVITNSEEVVSDISVHKEESPLIKSDHYLVGFKVTSSPSNHQVDDEPVYFFDYSRGDYEGLNEYLYNIDFLDCYQSNSVEYVWSIIKSTLSNAINQFIPTIKLRAKQHPKWFTPNLRHQIKCIRTLKRKYAKSPSEQNRIRLQTAEKCLNDEISLAKSVYESKLIHDFSSTNQSEIYRYIRSLTTSHSIPSTIYSGSSSALDDHNKATLFNQYFYSVFSSSNIDLPSDFDTIDSSMRSHIISITISEADVLNALTSLNPHKATGIDGIGPKILKNCALTLFKPIHYLFTLSLRKHTLPTEWCIHSIVPVFKSGDKTSVNNYRPISLLCNTSKIMEQLIYDKVISHILNCISPQQFGFLRNRSTIQQLLILWNNIINTNHQTDVIYLDFRKAFDSVPHHELLIKLRSIGISGNLWLWFKSYLLNRQQCVKINNKYSNLLPVLSGVPQGSILGPLLFLVYINDIPDCVISSLLLLFADDTKCSNIIRNPVDSHQLQDNIESLYRWSVDWNLKFNLSKCVQISFKPKSSTTYTIGSSSIVKTDSHRDLGILMSSNLSWEPHYHHIIAKAYKMLGLLRRTFSIHNPVHSKKLLFISLVRSQLMYCSVLWKPHLIKHIQLIERVQRRATKYILNDFTSNYKSRLLKLQMLPLMYILDLNDIRFFIKSLNSPHESFNIKNYISFATGATRLAANHKLQHTRCTDNPSNNFYFNRLPRIWNHLPVFNINLDPVTIKHKLHSYLWKHFENNFNSHNACSYSFLCPCMNCIKNPNAPNFNKL